ncbi:chemotaxis protein CheW [Ectopseudomonas mendocina]|uniref:chemotaxis protein CheW n=1 Tax=Ectopseudomonas mendocina TaxID=300 RepID=UPI003F02C73A
MSLSSSPASVEHHPPASTALATVAPEQNTPQQYLTFELNARRYALDGLSVREIIEYPQLTRVPMAAACIHGVINLRGAVVPVIDLSLRFGQGASRIDKRTCIIIVEVTDEEDDHVLGIIVDAVSEVLEVVASQVRPAPAFGNPIRADFIHGMVRLGDEFIVLLTIENTLAVAEIAASGSSKSARQTPERPAR